MISSAGPSIIFHTLWSVSSRLSAQHSLFAGIPKLQVWRITLLDLTMVLPLVDTNTPITIKGNDKIKPKIAIGVFLSFCVICFGTALSSTTKSHNFKKEITSLNEQITQLTHERDEKIKQLDEVWCSTCVIFNFSFEYYNIFILYYC